MNLKIFSVIFSLVASSTIIKSQNNAVPSDFKLTYYFKAGMLHEKESLSLDTNGLVYHYEKQNLEIDKKLKIDNKELLKLFEKINKTGLFGVKSPKTDIEITKEIFDKSTNELSWVYNKNQLHISDFTDLDYYPESDRKIISKSISVLKKFCEDLRRK